MLLNFEYKLMAKVLAECFNLVIGAVMDKGETCVVPEWHGALLLLLNVLWCQQERRLHIAVLKLDVEKGMTEYPTDCSSRC